METRNHESNRMVIHLIVINKEFNNCYTTNIFIIWKMTFWYLWCVFHTYNVGHMHPNAPINIKPKAVTCIPSIPRVRILIIWSFNKKEQKKSKPFVTCTLHNYFGPRGGDLDNFLYKMSKTPPYAWTSTTPTLGLTLIGAEFLRYNLLVGEWGTVIAALFHALVAKHNIARYSWIYLVL